MRRAYFARSATHRDSASAALRWRLAATLPRLHCSFARPPPRLRAAWLWRDCGRAARQLRACCGAPQLRQSSVREPPEVRRSSQGPRYIVRTISTTHEAPWQRRGSCAAAPAALTCSAAADLPQSRRSFHISGIAAVLRQSCAGRRCGDASAECRRRVAEAPSKSHECCGDAHQAHAHANARTISCKPIT
jgi:hypothetical protein